MLEIAVLAVAFLSASVASIVGFGIGSMLTPLFATAMDMRIAVAAVSVPHLIATALRFWGLRADLDKHVLLTFGLTSAAGGLTGALLQDRFGSKGLSYLLGVLLIFVCVSTLAGWSKRVKLKGVLSPIGGFLSGVFGGLVGNQGGIRSGALLGYEMSPRTFVAVATASGLLVDLARMPMYAISRGTMLEPYWSLIGLATIGVVAGTLFGGRLLRRIPEEAFRTVVAVVIGLLGVTLLVWPPGR
jgi:uncharacterized membrane protein YfcA